MDSDLSLSWALLGLFTALALLRGWHAWTARRERAASPDREGRGWVLLRTLLIMAQSCVVTCQGFHYIFGSFEWVSQFEAPLPPALRWTAFGFALASLLGLHWVHQTLGTFFSARLELRGEHALVTRGPYAYVRHPMYTALFAFFAAASLVSANGLVAALSLAIVLQLYLRIGTEERMMLEHFGEEYRAYMARTGRLVPKVGKS